MALLRGKLSREHENMEDILTSNVFGILQYLPPHRGLYPFLAQAEAVGGGKPLSFLGGIRSTKRGDVTYSFWPRWSDPVCRGCEPDLVLTAETGLRGRHVILVEAKLRSGKHPLAKDSPGCPKDQLAREWMILLRRTEGTGAAPSVVYLTADVVRPEEELVASQADYRRHSCGLARDTPAIHWLSWRHLAGVVDRCDEPMLADLGQLLDRLQMFFYRGVSPVRALGRERAHFVSRYHWQELAVHSSLPWGFAR